MVKKRQRWWDNSREGVRLQIEKKNRLYASKANKGRKLVVFQPGDWVWVHMRKERFPNQRKSKLQPHGGGPFQVLERINDKHTKLTFQVSMVLVLPLMLLILRCLTQIFIRGWILSRREGMMWTSLETPARIHYMFQMVQWLGPRQRHWMHWFWMFQPSQNWKVH